MAFERSSVLALFPTSPGYAYAYFQMRGRLFDWGLKRMSGSRRDRNAKSMTDIQALIDRYQPDSVVVEDWSFPGSRRSGRIRRLHRSIVHAAQTRLIEVEKYSRHDVRTTFASVGAMSRYEIAQAVGREFPALVHRLPRRRRSWESERSVMGIFAAVALALTSYSAGTS
jgi:hypothetical protein